MSGGYFNGSNWHIEDVASQIEELIRDNNDQRLNSWGGTIGRNYTPETIRRFRAAVTALRMASKMAHRIDYLVSDDDGEENFLKRWDEDLRI